jgi:hypothetical protein
VAGIILVVTGTIFVVYYSSWLGLFLVVQYFSWLGLLLSFSFYRCWDNIFVVYYFSWLGLYLLFSTCRGCDCFCRVVFFMADIVSCRLSLSVAGVIFLSFTSFRGCFFCRLELFVAGII